MGGRKREKMGRKEERKWKGKEIGEACAGVGRRKKEKKWGEEMGVSRVWRSGRERVGKNGGKMAALLWKWGCQREERRVEEENLK